MFDIQKMCTRHFVYLHVPYGNCSSLFTLTYYLILLHSRVHRHRQHRLTSEPDYPKFRTGLTGAHS